MVAEKIKAPTELQAMKSLKKLGYKYAVQFEYNGEDFGPPITFKSADQVGPFMREEKLSMRWTKNIDKYISELELATALSGE
jgi:hypothetical protein